MGLLCKCGDSIANLGLPGCAPIASALTKLIVVPLYSSTGVATSINPANVNNKAWITALVNNVDKSLRYQIMPSIKNITTDKSEATFEDFDDKSQSFVIEGVRTFKGILVNCPPKFKSKLESIRCQTGNAGVYEVDLNGSAMGLNFGTDNLLYPKPIDTGSLYAMVVNGDYKKAGQIMLSFNYPAFVNDASFAMISANDFPDFSFNSLPGILDADIAAVGVPSTSVIVVDVLTVYGALDQKAPISGLLIANFTDPVNVTTSHVYDATSAVSHAITSVTESATTPGRYTITLTVATTTLDNIQIGLSKTGFDGGLMASRLILTT